MLMIIYQFDLFIRMSFLSLRTDIDDNLVRMSLQAFRTDIDYNLFRISQQNNKNKCAITKVKEWNRSQIIIYF